jgi:hypothetical protein
VISDDETTPKEGVLTVTRPRASRPAPTRPRALEARHDLAIVGDPRELLEPAADCRRIEGVSLTGDPLYLPTA